VLVFKSVHITAVTGILAALANSNLHTALTLAFCHTYFNVAGILMWFVVPITRKVPISLARWMGNTTAKHRWFAIVYIITAFVLIPLGLLGLSLAGAAVFLGVLIPIVIVIAAVSIIALLRKHKPEILPGFLKDFSYLPAWMRTEPDWLKAYHAKLEAKAALQEAKRTTETPKLPWDERMMNRLGGDKTAESQVEMMA
jgi:sodium-dependent phosphate cotransporter